MSLLSIYPNPVADLLTVETGESVADHKPFCMRILNSSGSLFMERASMHQLMHVDVGWLAAGMEALRVVTAHPNAG